MFRVYYNGGLWQEFGMFGDALDFYAKTPRAQWPVNMEQADGAPDATNPNGLTAEQRQALLDL